MSQRPTFVLLLPFLLLMQAVPALGQYEAIAACRAIAEREARYACYDGAEAAQPRAAMQTDMQTDMQAGSPAAPPTAAPASVEEFGKATAHIEQRDDGKTELVDRVLELKSVQHKQWQITLESGQVWRQMLSQTFNLRPGYEVRITPISNGPNHRLSSPQVAGSIQVRRVR